MTSKLKDMLYDKWGIGMYGSAALLIIGGTVADLLGSQTDKYILRNPYRPLHKVVEAMERKDQKATLSDGTIFTAEGKDLVARIKYANLHYTIRDENANGVGEEEWMRSQPPDLEQFIKLLYNDAVQKAFTELAKKKKLPKDDKNKRT